MMHIQILLFRNRKYIFFRESKIKINSGIFFLEIYIFYVKLIFNSKFKQQNGGR